MRKEFLALVEKVKATGIADALCKAATVDERLAALNKFQKENKDIFKEIVSWGEEFDEDEGPLFNEGETIQNPLEIAICIYISDTGEGDIFENWEDLQSAIRNLGNGYAVKLADAMDKLCISEMEISDPSNERVKEDFLAFVEKVKATGIADALCNANTRDEREIVLAKFGKENQGIIREIASWGKKFEEYEGPLFNEGETIQNPLEIAVCICISDTYEGDIFKDWEDLQFAIRSLGSEYAVKFASAMDKFCIEGIEFSDPSNERFKEEFLALVEKVKATGIADALCKAATVDERLLAWGKFQEENQDLFKEIASWSDEFYDDADDPIFNKGETIQNPLEIVVCIYISDISGNNIFEDWEDLRAEIRNLGNGYAIDLADAMDETRISCIEITEPIDKDED